MRPRVTSKDLSEVSACPIRPNSSERLRKLYSEFENAKGRLDRTSKRRENSLLNNKSACLEQIEASELVNSKHSKKELRLPKPQDPDRDPFGLLPMDSLVFQAKHMPRSHKRISNVDFAPVQAQFQAMSSQLFELCSQRISEKVKKLEQKTAQCEQLIVKLKDIFRQLISREKVCNKYEAEHSGQQIKLVYTRSTTFDTLSGRKSSDKDHFSPSISSMGGRIVQCKHQLERYIELEKDNIMLSRQVEDLNQKITLKDDKIKSLLTQLEGIRSQSLNNVLDKFGSEVDSFQMSLNQVSQLDKSIVDSDQARKEIFEIQTDLTDLKDNLSQCLEPKRHIKQNQDQRQLELEVSLFEQENLHLLRKKHIIDSQLKQNQLNQERFQLQSRLLNEQIRRLRGIVSNLDSATVTYIRTGKIETDRVETLPPQIKSREAFLLKKGKRSSTARK